MTEKTHEQTIADLLKDVEKAELEARLAEAEARVFEAHARALGAKMKVVELRTAIRASRPPAPKPAAAAPADAEG